MVPRHNLNEQAQQCRPVTDARVRRFEVHELFRDQAANDVASASLFRFQDPMNIICILKGHFLSDNDATRCLEDEDWESLYKGTITMSLVCTNEVVM
jgi:hypothetical protein